jgi:hypothetical protein
MDPRPWTVEGIDAELIYPIFPRPCVVDVREAELI